MTLIKSEDIKWFFVGTLKALLLMCIAVTGIVCIAYYRFLPIGQQTEFLPVAIFCVGIMFILLTIIQKSPVSYHNLVCKHNELKNKPKAENQTE